MHMIPVAVVAMYMHVLLSGRIHSYSTNVGIVLSCAERVRINP